MSPLMQHTNIGPYTSWKIGGPAEQLLIPRTVEELSRYLGDLPIEQPLFCLGLGSNVLALDRGFVGSVIVTAKYLREMKLVSANEVYAQCGVPQAHLARFLARHNLTGGEFHASIPGTVGGALAMNAGAFGGETWNNVVELTVMNRSGRVYTRQAGEYQFSYRRVHPPAPDEIYIGARMRFEPSECERVRSKIKEFLRLRSETQPIGEKSCGSVFVNPRPLSAGRIIDECGLKGYQIGAAKVSEFHANFIINTGNASSEQVLALVRHIQTTVNQRCRQRLRPEFRILARQQDRPLDIYFSE